MESLPSRAGLCKMSMCVCVPVFVSGCGCVPKYVIKLEFNSFTTFSAWVIHLYTWWSNIIHESCLVSSTSPMMHCRWMTVFGYLSVPGHD